MSGLGAVSDYRWNGNEVTRASTHGVAFLGRMTHREREAARGIQRDREIAAELDYMHTHPYYVSRNIQRLAPTVHDEDCQHTHTNYVPRSTRRPASMVYDGDYIQHSLQVLQDIKQLIIQVVRDRIETTSLEQAEDMFTQLCNALDKVPEYEIEDNVRLACSKLHTECNYWRTGSGISTELWERLRLMMRYSTTRHR